MRKFHKKWLSEDLKASFASSRGVSIGMGFLRVLKSLLSIYTISLSAAYFGVSKERDSWVMAGAIVTTLTSFLFGPLTNIFRTKFIHTREEEGEAIAVQRTAGLLGAIFSISIAVILVIEVFPRPITNFFAPGFNIEEERGLIMMTQILIPSLIINQFITIWTAILNSYSSFFIPDIFGFFSGIINVLAIIIFAPYIHIYSLVFASYISTIILAIILLKELRKRGITLYKFHFSWSDFKPYLLFALPLYLNFFAGQLLSVVERRLCSYLGTGTVSAFDYAKRTIDLGLNVILSIVPMVLTPILATHFAQKKQNEFNSELFQNLRMFMLGVLPIVVVLTFFPEDVTKLILSKGNLEPDYLYIIHNTFFWLGIGVAGVVLYVISGEALVAQKKIKLITITSSAAYLLMAALDIFFYKDFGAPIFACSWALVHLVLGLGQTFFAALETKKIIICKELIKVFSIYFGTFLVFYIATPILTSQTSISLTILKLIGVCITIVTIMIVQIFAFKLEERLLVKKICVKFFSKLA